MTLLIIAFVAGMFSVLTPCILPVLPALLVVSDGQGKARVFGVVVGVVVSFCIAILALTAIVDALGIPADVLRYVSATLLLLFALVLLIPKLDERFQIAAQSVVRLAPAQHQGNGFVPGMLAGATLGLVWAPCAGPILAGITSSIATEGLSSKAVVATVGYGLGMAIPLTAVAFGGRALVGRLRKATGNGRRVNVAMGVVLLATSLLFFSGFDNTLNKTIADNLPLSSTPVASLERGGFDKSNASRTASSCREAEQIAADPAQVAANGYPEAGELCDLGPAPSIDDLGPWINTKDGKPVTADDLKGKVVLVDFWTYSCINCIRTLPYIRGWYDQYKDDGFVVIGAHTPEFAFERDFDNVKKATKDLEVNWPVGLDNDYDTWNAYSNRFWPAKYLIDRDGTLRYAHYGEGEYDRTEELIRTLLDVKPGEGMATSDGAVTDIRSATPETYAGYERAANFAGTADSASGVGSGFDSNRVATYRQAVDALDLNQWSLIGDWKVEGERGVAAGDDSRLRMHYAANEAYLVMSPPAGGKAVVKVTVDGKRRNAITVDGNRLYTIASEGEFGSHTVELTLPKGTAAYAFTFG